MILEGQKVIFTNILCFLSTVLGFSTLVLPIGNFFTENLDLLKKILLLGVHDL